MPRPLIINVQSQRRNYITVPNTEADIENDHRDVNVSSSEYNLSDHHHHHHGKKSKRSSHEKKSHRRENESRIEKSTITRSKSLADLKRNRHQHGQEKDNSKTYQRRHSNTESNPKMFNFRETFSMFENLSTGPQNVYSTRTKGKSTVEKEASDLKEIDQIKARARLLVQEAQHVGRQNYLEWQDEVVELLKKIGEIDNRNSTAVQREKQNTLKIFKQSYNNAPTETKRVENVEATTVQNGVSKNEIYIPTVTVSQLRNIYEPKQLNETTNYPEVQNSYKSEEPQNLDDSEYTSLSGSLYSSSLDYEEKEHVYETYEDEVQQPRERNVVESPIAKVRDLRDVFEKDNGESPSTDTRTKLSTHVVTKPGKWVQKHGEEDASQEESSRIYQVEDKGQNDEEVLYSVPVKDLRNVFEGNGLDANYSTMQVTLEQKYIPYEEYYTDNQQTAVITEFDNEEDPVDASHIATVEELRNAIERNVNNSQNATDVDQIKYQVVTRSKHQPYVEIEKTERAVISEVTSTNETVPQIEEVHEDSSTNENEPVHEGGDILVEKVREDDTVRRDDDITTEEAHEDSLTKENEPVHESGDILVEKVNEDFSTREDEAVRQNDDITTEEAHEDSSTNENETVHESGDILEEKVRKDSSTMEDNTVRQDDDITTEEARDDSSSNENEAVPLIDDIATEEVNKDSSSNENERVHQNGDITTEEAHGDSSTNDDFQHGTKIEVTVKPNYPEEESPEVEEVVKHYVAVKETELDDQERVLISKKVLDEINDDIHSYEKEIVNLDVEDEKKRMFLNEMLLRSVIQLENFETYQNEELLRERKETLLFVRECIRKLKEKIPEDTETNC